MDSSLSGSSVHGILQASTGVGSHFLLQGLFLTQESNLGLLHFRQMIYQLKQQKSWQWHQKSTFSELEKLTKPVTNRGSHNQKNIKQKNLKQFNFSRNSKFCGIFIYLCYLLWSRAQQRYQIALTPVTGNRERKKDLTQETVVDCSDLSGSLPRGSMQWACFLSLNSELSQN